MISGRYCFSVMSIVNRLLTPINMSQHSNVLQRCRLLFQRQQCRQIAACMPLLLLMLSSCSGTAGPNGDAAASGTGTLLGQANGEDFVRNGFTGKDGWRIDFDHLYVTMTDVTAAQNPLTEAGESEAGPEESTQPQQSVVYGASPVTVDLAAGNGPTEAIDFADAPSGRYNELAWQLVPAQTGPAEGYPIMLIGTATKDADAVSFEIGLADEIAYTCGDFIGDERKGILTNGKTAEVEATFHFDHMFGDVEAPETDKINLGALGFEPLAELSQGGQLTIDSQELQDQLSEKDYATLQATLLSLGHVGEGHCGARITNET